jgi:hypothetical protein
MGPGSFGSSRSSIDKTLVELLIISFAQPARIGTALLAEDLCDF